MTNLHPLFQQILRPYAPPEPACAKCGGPAGTHWIGCPTHMFNLQASAPAPEPTPCKQS